MSEPLPANQLKALAVIKDGGSQGDAADAANVSRSTIGRWKKAWDAAGVDWKTPQAAAHEEKYQQQITEANARWAASRAAEMHNSMVTAVAARDQLLAAVQLLDPALVARSMKAVRDLAVVYGIMTDKSIKLADAIVRQADETLPADGPDEVSTAGEMTTAEVHKLIAEYAEEANVSSIAEFRERSG